LLDKIEVNYSLCGLPLVALLILLVGCSGDPHPSKNASARILGESGQNRLHIPASPSDYEAIGDPDAKFRIGMTRLKNDEIDKGIKALKKASSWGNAHAMFHLGALHFGGIARNGSHVLKPFIYAALSDAEWPRNLKTMVSYERAFSWFKKSAELENSDAQYAVGYLLARGVGVEKDLALAKTYLEKAFQNGQYLSGLDLAELTDSFTEQEYFLLPAAKKNVPDAMYELAMLYLIVGSLKGASTEILKAGLSLEDEELIKMATDTFEENTGGMPWGSNYDEKADYWGKKAYNSGIEDAIMFVL